MAASSKTLSFILLGVCVGNCALVAAALGAGWLSVNDVAFSLFDLTVGSPPSSLTGARACGVIAGILIYLQALIVLVAALSSKARFIHANVAGMVGAVFAIASFASWFSFFNNIIGDVNNGAGSWLMFVSGLVALATVGLGFKVNSKGSGSSAPPAPRSPPRPSQSQQQSGQPPPPPPMQEMPRRNTTTPTPVGGAAMTDPNYNPFKPVETQSSQMQRV